ncbi:MAG: DUF4230 domain-containing protein [Bacteroidaceae bacterium]|nr:DUF4230 domain-containing protein [Bacteroidaceae bacterium]
MKCIFEKYLIAALLSIFIVSCDDNGGGDDVVDEHKEKEIESLILSSINKKADLVTTEVKIRKLAIYDSSKHEKFVLTNLSTWKYGDRKCVMPVDITIKYGYDLRDVSIDDIKLTDDSTAVVILVPKPKVIDSGYNVIVDDNEIVRMSTGFRDIVSHEEMEVMKKKAYDSVMKEDMTKYFSDDIKNNMNTIFTSIVKSLDMKCKTVYVVDKEEWKGGK